MEVVNDPPDRLRCHLLKPGISNRKYQRETQSVSSSLMTSPTGTQWEQALLSKITSNGERIAVVERDISDIKDRLKGMDNRLIGLENRQTLVENRLTDVENRLTGVENRLTGVENRLTGIDNQLTRIDNRLTGVEKTMEKIESLLSWLKWIGGGIVAIALSLIANFVYSVIAYEQ